MGTSLLFFSQHEVGEADTDTDYSWRGLLETTKTIPAEDLNFRFYTLALVI